MTLVYLRDRNVLRAHASIFECSEDEARDRVRDRAGLETAVARPAMYAHYCQADLALQAAVLAHSIAERQVFIDGNKRTALVVMLLFLEANGRRLTASESDLFEWMLALSQGMDSEELAARLRAALTPAD